MSPDLIRYDKATRETTSVTLWKDAETPYVTDLEMTEESGLVVAGLNRMLVSVNPFTDEVTELEMTEEERATCARHTALRATCLLKDSAGEFWAGTTANGLLRHSKRGAVTVVNYFKEDGIGGDQFSERASCVLPDGTLVFGGTHGLTWFNPLDVPQKRSVPLVFEDLKIHNVLVEPGKGAAIGRELRDDPDIVIRDDQNAFSISFAALDFSGLERTHYYYMMEGYDRRE